jgi:hypothetical protein
VGSNADAALQIHGGNGYALEFEISRVLCDARILNIFEGAAEIQAQVIGRGLPVLLSDRVQTRPSAPPFSRGHRCPACPSPSRA